MDKCVTYTRFEIKEMLSEFDKSREWLKKERRTLKKISADYLVLIYMFSSINVYSS